MRSALFKAALGLLVLAVGIALGAGPLQHSARERDKELAAQKAEVTRAERQVRDLTRAGDFASSYAQATAATLVAGKLTGRTVALVRLPGARQATVDAVRSLLGTAGATVTAEAAFAPQLAKASSRQLVEALTSQMVTQTPNLGVPATAAGYERFGLLLARAIGASGTTAAGTAYDQAAIGIVSGLETAGLVDVGRVGPRASVAVVVAGPPAKDPQSAAANAVPVTILRSFGSKVPTVLAGSTAAAGNLGVLGALRADAATARSVSGVDSVQTPMGRVALVLALADRARGKVGQYGGVGEVTGPVPVS
ncbi:MAG: copper transporter [Nocardioidaceae bacterium]|nr:copper transporter [Nocardioidaceae bacterium]